MALSGGMDSSALMLHLLREGYDVTAVSFDYGQKHRIELDRASDLVAYLADNGFTINHHQVDLKSAMAMFHSDLLTSGGDVPTGHY